MSRTEGKAKDKAKGKAKFNIMPKNNWLKALLFAELITALVFMTLLTFVDVFPKNIVAILLAVLIYFLVMSIILLRSRSKKKTARVIGVVLSSVLIVLYGGGSYYLASAFSMFNRISVDSIAGSGVDVTSEAFNIYVTGIDQWESEKGYDLERSDVNMIMTVNPNTKTILLTSMPRDSYVALHKNGKMDKLTHSGIYGVDETLNTVSDWFDGLEFDYYIKVNFSTFVDVVDAIGGIDVDNDVEFTSWIREDYHYPVGTLHLDGSQALYFARERKSFEEEDEKRIANQQKVLKAVLNKCLTSKTILLNYQDLLNAAGDNMETNLTPKQMNALVKMQLSDLGAWTIKQQAVSGEGAMRTVASMSSKNQYYVSVPNQDTVDACIEGINAVMNPSEEEIEKVSEERKTAKQEQQAQSFFKKIFSGKKSK